MKSVALILTRPPFANGDSHDALDMAMVLGSFEIFTALFFVNAGVNQLRKLQPEVVEVKDFTKSFAALPFYDVEELYVCDEDMLHWGMSGATLNKEFKVISRAEMQSKLIKFDRVIRF